MVNPFEAYAEKRTDPFVKYLRKKDILERVEQQLTPAIRSYVKTTFERGHAQVIPNIPELIAQELKKLPPKVIEKVLEKETIVKEVTKEDKKKYAEEKSLIVLKRELDELKDLMEKFKQSVSLGGSGVVGLPSMDNQSDKFLTNRSGKAFWAAASTGSDGTITLGDGVSDGSWRLRVSGTDLLHERLESGVWTEKGRDTA